MVDFTAPNLQGANAAFNNIVSKLNDTKNSALSNLQADASAAASELSSQLADVNTELRSLVPEPSSIPNVNLQAQLQSLSGLTNPLQSANLLADITSSFGDALTTSGFDLDSLVSSAAGVFGTETSLSGLIPNFELSAAGDVIQKAAASKLASIDPVTEEAAAFVSNTNFRDAKIAAASAVYPTLEEAPTTDTEVFKLASKSKKVTRSSGKKSITSEVTTATQTITTTVSGGGEKTFTRANISPSADVGMATRPTKLTEYFKQTDIIQLGRNSEFGTDIKVKLKYKIINVVRVTGRTEEQKRQPTGSGRAYRVSSNWEITDLDGYDDERILYDQDDYEILRDTNEILIHQSYRIYDNISRGSYNAAIKVRYTFNEIYDPTYKTEPIVIT